MLIGYVSDEYYAALPGVAFEMTRDAGAPIITTSTASGAIYADAEPGRWEICLSKDGFGSKRVSIEIGDDPHQFRLLRDDLLGYAWPKWCRAGDRVEFRVHSVEPYELGLWRYGIEKEFIRNIGWYDNHGPRAAMQTVPDGFFSETGVAWDNGFGGHRQVIDAPNRTGLYYFHAKTESGRFFSFPLVVAPPQPESPIAVLASTNTWNAYNPFGGRSNYIMAAKVIDTPIVNSKSDLPRYNLKQYGEWKSNTDFAPLSFDRPEPYNHIPEHVECTDPIEGRQSCHLAPAEWRLLGWMEKQGFAYDLYADYQLHDGTLDLSKYRVLVLSVHPEYWSAEMYRRVKQWVNAGGRLLYLGGNGINCRAEFLDDGKTMRCHNQWPDNCESRFHAAVESEANLLGVVFSDAGAMTSAPYEVIDAGHWVFENTGLKNGDTFGYKTLHERYPGGASGHETDKMSPHSPKNTKLLAKGLNRDDGGAHIVMWEAANGGCVFSVGSITYPAALFADEAVAMMTGNVFRRFLA